MPTGRGFQHIMGVKKETTLGTAVAVDTKICYISDTLDEQYQHIQNQALLGTGAPKASIQSVKQVPGGFVSYLTYKLANPLLTAYLGTHTVAGSADNHYDMDENIDGDGLTVAIDKQVSVHQYSGFKPSTMTLAGSPSDGVRLTLEGFGMGRSLAPTLNSGSVLAALTEPPTEVKFTDLTLRVGDLADALASGDNIAVTGFQLTSSRNLQQDEVNSTTLLEAVENAFRQGTLTINVPRYTSNQFLTWHSSHTTLQAELAFDNGTDGYIKWRMPQLKVVSVPVQTGGPGLLPMTITMSLHNNLDNANANTGFDFDQELRVFEEDGS